MNVLSLIKAKLNKKEPRYSYYIHSPQWRAKAHKEYQKWNHRCALCHRKVKLHVHHSTYEHLGHEQRGELVVLCEDCHAIFHSYYRYSGATGTFILIRKIK